MTQTVLPQTPAPGTQNDIGPPKPGSARDSSAGESRYESVSRAEQKRLDRQRSERNDEARDVRSAQERRPEKDGDVRSVNSSEPENGGKTSATDEGKPGDKAMTDTATADAATADTATADQASLDKSVEAAPEMEATTTPLTFADLQALLLPATGQAGAAGKTAAGAAATGAGIAQGTELFAGLFGGKPGQGASGSAGSAGSAGGIGGLSLSDGLFSLGAEKAGATDPSNLLAGTRFGAALELVSQQGAYAGGKLATEAQVPLRSYATSIDVPVSHAEWGDKLMGKLSWLTAKNLSVAEIHLTPPDMGPMEVRVRVYNEQATITVHAANPVVRDQLEQNSHRLRDMLGEQGLSLAQFDVSDNSQNQRGEQGAGDGEGSSSGAGAGPLAAEGGEAATQAGSLDLSWNGAVDLFA